MAMEYRKECSRFEQAARKSLKADIRCKAKKDRSKLIGSMQAGSLKLSNLQCLLSHVPLLIPFGLNLSSSKINRDARCATVERSIINLYLSPSISLRQGKRRESRDKEGETARERERERERERKRAERERKRAR